MECKLDFKSLLIFEFKSWLGRNFLETKPQLHDENNYLNLGCGLNILDGYINADFFYKFKFWKKNKIKKQWQLDLRYPLNCRDEIFDGIYSEHVLEHLYPSQVENLLIELYRVLKEGSIIRITVPDIEKYINFYNGNNDKIDIEKFNKTYTTGCSAIRNITQNYLHLSVWDFKELKKYLANTGFKNIRRMTFNDSKDDKLKIDIKDREFETLYVEAFK